MRRLRRTIGEPPDRIISPPSTVVARARTLGLLRARPTEPPSGRESRMHYRSWRGLVLVAGLALSACGTSALPGNAFPLVANADLAVGPQRLLVGIVTAESESIASSELAVEFDLYRPGSEEIASSVPGEFMWTVPDVRGLYRADAVFDGPGLWQLVAHTGTEHRGDPIPFNVAADALTPDVGDPAPRVATPTAPPAAIADISTDPEPDPDFYRTSLDEALNEGLPTVVVFSTPALCETATCGPLLDNVKSIAKDHSDVAFIHVEIYENLDATSPNELRISEPVEAWNLPTEPWVFVIDSNGAIAARFEGSASPEELDRFLARLP